MHRTVEIVSFAGREKSGNHKWTEKEVNFPNYFSMFLKQLDFNVLNF